MAGLGRSRPNRHRCRPPVAIERRRRLLIASNTGHKVYFAELPAFVRGGGAESWGDVLADLELSGHFLARDLLPERARPIGAIRARLLERLKPAAD